MVDRMDQYHFGVQQAIGEGDLLYSVVLATLEGQVVSVGQAGLGKLQIY